MNEYFIAWWNVENLFAKFDDPERHAWLQRYLGRELSGWTDEVLDRKLAQLASVIVRMNDGLGPICWACAKSRMKQCFVACWKP